METIAPIKPAVRAFLIETFLHGADADDLDDDLHLVEHGIIDSIRVLALVEFMEETYDILIEPEDLFRLVSVAAISEVIREKQAG